MEMWLVWVYHYTKVYESFCNNGIFLAYMYTVLKRRSTIQYSLTNFQPILRSFFSPAKFSVSYRRFMGKLTQELFVPLYISGISVGPEKTKGK